ncbi:MAG: alpha-hydroxy-acid oxidizing protein [Gammaproteobacteria bacterium]|nr:alpha-hydroxy-acid oxidizing protein [Gammaproteobacteria bacterium]
MRRYPAVSYLEARARRRMPFFAWEYLASGTGDDAAVRRNRERLDTVLFTPRFMQGPFEPALATELFGVRYAAPFGIAPVGLTGLMWPDAECILAKAAAKYRIPYGLSTVATQAPETVGPLASGMGWFQLYPPRNSDTRKDLLKRARDSGFTALLVTVDVPANSRRERQARAGVSVPPRITPLTLYRCAVRPAWSLAALRGGGLPRFRGLEQYAGATDLAAISEFIGTQFNGTLDWEYVSQVRDEWDGPVLLKGVMDVDEALHALRIGIDGLVVSNHGGRQFDGVPAAIDVLPGIAEAVAGRCKIVFDSGVRSGLDMLRAIALGADFVLLGRAFMFGVGALGERGGDHVIDLLLADLATNMSQLGCATLAQLKDRLYRP